ncbi:MAG: hypothetical protein P1Q69_05305, partial [Candidatus Thorarchaeota archaeon]|nr:hypothetical protein [Candidatus Thorarchaeota archaeon]
VDHWYVYELAVVNHGGVAEDLVAVDYFGNATMYNGEDLSVDYEIVVTTAYPDRGFRVKSANLTLNPIEDYIAIDGDAGVAYFIDGNGTIIHTVSNVENTGNIYFDVGLIDSDGITDVLIEDENGYPALARGVDGIISYSVSSIGIPDRFRVYELNGDHRDDFIVRTEGDEIQMHAIISDVDTPILSPQQIEPLHPTVLDDYIEFEVVVDDDSPIDISEIYYRAVGDALWLRPHDGLFSTSDGRRYYAFLVGLGGGNYEYYYKFRDAYLNTAFVGNATNPLGLTVVGNYEWSFVPDSMFGSGLGGYNRIALGNQSDGSNVIYIAYLSSSGGLNLTTYSESGTVLNSTSHPYAQGYDFELISGNLDGDNVIDVVLIVSNKAIGPDTRVYAYHGINLSRYYESESPVDTKILDYLDLSDVDGDGLDELTLVKYSPPYATGVMDDTGSWINNKLPDNLNPFYLPNTMATAHLDLSGDAYIAIGRGKYQVDIIEADTLNPFTSLTFNLGTYSDIDIVDIRTYCNASSSLQKFLVELTLWDGAATSTAFAFIDISSGTLDVADMDIIPGRNHRWSHMHDVDQDGSDDLFIISTSGEVSLIRFNPYFSILWNATITDATPTTSVITDFIGDGQDELAVFTKEDKTLTTLSFNGAVNRELFVGEIHGAIPIGDVDPGEGNEIAVYPIVTEDPMELGVVRDLDWFYRLNVSVTHSATQLEQKNEFWSFVEVVNIYDELVPDATVFIEVQFNDAGETRTETFSYFFNESNSLYQLSIGASWPIGVVNLSVSANHELYHDWKQESLYALTVRSPLSVEIHTEEIVPQGEDQFIEVWVTDSRGFTVLDANVTIEIEGTEFSPTISEPFYVYDNVNVTLPAGEYEVTATAEHLYATLDTNATVGFRVQTITADLVVVDNFQRNLIQFDNVASWFNITDAYGYSISEADVSLRLGPTVFEMRELAPGCYYLERPFDVEIGYHSFELFVEKAGFENPRAAWVNVTVRGRLAPGIFYEPNVEAEGSLNITITMKDNKGPVTAGTWVIIEIGDQNYTAIQHPEFQILFSVTITVNVGAGRNSFRVIAGATYANETFTEIRQFYVRSIATAIVTSSQGWEITQGDSAEIFVNLYDWLELPANATSATLFIGRSSYSLARHATGSYSVLVSTSGWESGIYNYTVFIQDLYLELEPTMGELLVRGSLSIEVEVMTQTPRIGERLEIEVAVYDRYDNPVPGLEISVAIEGIFAEVQESGEPGRYTAVFEIVSNTNWGDKNINVTAENEFSVFAEYTSPSFKLGAALPVISLSPAAYGITTGLAFVLSFVGLFAYFKMASSMRIEGKDVDSLKRSVKRMDRLYIVIVGATGVAAIASGLAYIALNYELAVILAITILGVSVLLYGLWLYRDAVASILVYDKLSRKRMILGLWHLFFLPLTIFMILIYGAKIGWFDEHVVQASIDIAGITIPKITTTIVTSFLSSIIVVVLNVYRETSQGIKKLDRMIASNTPEDVLQAERTMMVQKASSSIRIKFLLFLVVVGGATVLSIDFIISQYSILLIVLIPVLFLVVIPFISSKVLQALGFMKSKVTGEEIEYSSGM